MFISTFQNILYIFFFCPDSSQGSAYISQVSSPPDISTPLTDLRLYIIYIYTVHCIYVAGLKVRPTTHPTPSPNPDVHLSFTLFNSFPQIDRKWTEEEKIKMEESAQLAGEFR